MPSDPVYPQLDPGTKPKCETCGGRRKVPCSTCQDSWCYDPCPDCTPDGTKETP